MRVDLNKLPGDDWLHFLRARDLRQVLAGLPESVKGPVLEVGCGDGFLTTQLRRRFDQVIPVDIRPRAYVDRLCVASAEALPFADGYFGFVFSSNVLEHVENPSACYGELDRVTRSDATMVHAMPTPFWKALQVALYPFHVLQVQLGKLMGRREKVRFPAGVQVGVVPCSVEGSERVSGEETWERKRSRLLPPIHGVSPSHLQEMSRFRRNWWVDQFSRNGFYVYRTAPLYLHSAYRLLPYRGLRLRELASRLGLSSVVAYWVRKAP